jgi:hypothetical protein
MLVSTGLQSRLYWNPNGGRNVVVVASQVINEAFSCHTVLRSTVCVYVCTYTDGSGGWAESNRREIYRHHDKRVLAGPPPILLPSGYTFSLHVASLSLVHKVPCSSLF